MKKETTFKKRITNSFRKTEKNTFFYMNIRLLLDILISMGLISQKKKSLDK